MSRYRSTRSSTSAGGIIGVVIALGLVVLGVPSSTLAGSRLPSAPTARSQAAPLPPAAGHLHLLAAPTRIASSLTGLGLPKHSVAANAAPLLTVAGAGGLPGTGILAIAIVLTTSAPTGATSIRIGPATTTPLLMTSGGTTSAFAIVPVTLGSIQLRNGAHATQLTIDAVGWFSSANEPGNSGLFRLLAGRSLGTITVAAGATQALDVLGAQDVPSSGVSAVMVRLRTVSSAAGAITVGPSGVGVTGYVSAAFRQGTNSDLALVKVGASGTIAIRNSGARSATVSVFAAGWFTDGSDSNGFGDALSLATPFKALNAARVLAGGTSPTVCGLSGLPAELSSTPPSLVLARGLATSATTATTLLADAVGASPSGTAALVIKKTKPIAGQLLLAPGSACGTRVATTKGAATITVEPYAWFGGGTIISDRARVLTGPVLSAITSLTDTTVTFTGASLPNLAIGDVISAGISATTPVGLLRKVTALSHGTNRLVLTTIDALLSEAVLQGSLSAGQSETPPAVALPTLRQASESLSAQAATSCGVTGSPLSGDATVTCTHSMGDGSTWSATAYASASVSMTVDVDIHWGLPPSAHVATTVGVSIATSATATATFERSIDETIDLGKIRGKPIQVGEIGPVPIVIVPEFTATLHTTGKLEATFTATARVDAGASVSYDSDTGFTPAQSTGQDGSGSYNATLEANIRVAFEPIAKALFYGLDGSYISLGLTPWVEVKADSCTIIGHAGVDLTLGVSVGITEDTSASHDFTLPVLDTNIFTIPWSNCAVWTGTLTFRENDHYKDNQGRSVEDTNWSDNVTIAPPTAGVPPPDGFYTATGSGSGALNAYQYSCDPRLPPFNTPPALELPWTWAYTWGGDMNLANQLPYFETSDGFTVMIGPYLGTIVGGGTLDSACDHDDGLSWTHRLSFDQFYALVDPASGYFKFATPAGQSDFTGSFELDTPQDNGGMVHLELTYALHRTCTQGGTDC